MVPNDQGCIRRDGTPDLFHPQLFACGSIKRCKSAICHHKKAIVPDGKAAIADSAAAAGDVMPDLLTGMRVDGVGVWSERVEKHSAANERRREYSSVSEPATDPRLPRWHRRAKPKVSTGAGRTGSSTARS